VGARRRWGYLRPVLAPRLVPLLLVAIGALALPSTAVAQEGDVDCSSFASQAEAQAFFDASDPDTDPHGLDGDADYVACESNPCPCSNEAQPDPLPPKPKPRGYRSERVEHGDVVAELSYVVRRGRYSSIYRSRRIRIARDGQLLVDAALPRPPGCDARCAQFVRPHDFNVRGGALFLRDLDADGGPEVVVDLWTGGANCCTFSVVYGFRRAAGTYRHDSELWGTGYRLRRLGSGLRYQFLGYDERFKYAFACGACAPLPVRVWQYGAGRVSVVTRQHPTVVGRNARRSWRAYLRARNHPAALIRGTTRGRLAAWVADQCSLRRCKRGFRAVRRAQRRGELGKAYRYDFGPFGQAYVRKLKRLLRRYGYMR
jgi:hypothetical protein